jgi:hypothetical protein
MASVCINYTVTIRFKWLLLAINIIPVMLGYSPIVPKWFLVINMEK